ncbi:hypothetical protein JZO70_21620 [Enterococcus sp. 669A]|uniref:WxL domain-containing protein n=1 Tax=Candidatus Enterococcus moelleringii TaxID=2815325 RepID=A0ABS3LGM1_9ENTE|nr:L-type lectin-domain containing protein [Enterococcus sp. 669A]MBO1308786.1 hypothetical protein [Enterococcus sp. 669A]
MSKNVKGLVTGSFVCFMGMFSIFTSESANADSNLNHFLNEEAKTFVPIEGNFHYGADASLVGENVVKVTESLPDQKGIVWADQQLDMTQNWSTEMKLFLGYDQWQGNRNADGMAFVLHNDPRGKEAVGDFGERLGVWGVNEADNYVRNGWAVEFDLYANTTNGNYSMDADIYGASSMHNYGHIANSYTSVEGKWLDQSTKFAMWHNDLMIPGSTVDRLNNGRTKTFKASWNADTKQLTYNVSYVDEADRVVDYGTVTKQLDMNKFGSEKLYWGFTGSTGQQMADQYVGFQSFPETINAEVIPQETILGEALTIDESNLSDYVTITSGDDVKVASIKNEVDYYLIGTQNILVELSDKHGNSKTVEVPVTVKWGNSVVYGSYDYRSNDRSSAAFTLKNGAIPYITASKGIDKINDMLHTLLPEELYYSFNWFDLTNKNSLLMTEDSNGDKFINAKGKELKIDKLKEWGTNQRQQVNYGDVVRAWQFETSKNWLHEDATRHTYNQGKPAVYYEIHQNGYRLLHFNHLVSKEGTVPLYSSQEYLDGQASDFINLKGYPNIKALKFSEYPDTKTTGRKNAKVRVAETLLATGKTVEYDYDVVVNVEDTREVTAQANPQTTVLGTDRSTIDYSKFVKDVKFGEQTLSADQYTAELTNEIATDYIGEQTAEVRVTLNADKKRSVDVSVPVNVIWGNSVVFGSYDYYALDRTAAAFTLHPGAKPIITAAQGKEDDNMDMHNYFYNQQYYSFNWFDFTNKQTFLMTEDKMGDHYLRAEGQDLKRDTLKKWGTKQKQDVNNGDVVRAWQAETSKNWLYEDEQKNTYNQDKQAVYYEITNKGYRPLHFNHLAAKSGSIQLFTTKKELDEKVNDYIDLKGYPNIEVLQFTDYPDTTAAGSKKGTILVEETLVSTNKKVQYEYEVTFEVTPGELTLSAPESLSFGKIKKSKREQIVPRQTENKLGLTITDSRGADRQGRWRLTAQASNTEDKLAPYLVYKSHSKDSGRYLNQQAVEIYSQEKQTAVKEALKVDVSEEWTEDTGLLLKIPSKNDLENKEHTTKITWNLLEGPQ